MKASEYINETAKKTARAVVGEFKRAGLIKESNLGTFKKTEKALYEFPKWKECDGDETRRFVLQIEKALDGIRDEPYFELIELKYFRGWTHEKIAEHFDVDEKAIRYQRKKLIEQLRPVIFSDEFIRELIFEL